VGKLEAAAPDRVHVQAEERQVGPMVPADQLRLHSLQVGQGDVDLDRPGPNHVRVGQDQAVGGQQDPGPDAGFEPAGALVESDLPDVDPHHRIQQGVEASTDIGRRQDRKEEKEKCSAGQPAERRTGVRG